jgi:hypothetical protein
MEVPFFEGLKMNLIKPNKTNFGKTTLLFPDDDIFGRTFLALSG